jgi:hypothetical protein
MKDLMTCIFATFGSATGTPRHGDRHCDRIYQDKLSVL